MIQIWKGGEAFCAQRECLTEQFQDDHFSFPFSTFRRIKPLTMFSLHLQNKRILFQYADDVG